MLRNTQIAFVGALLIAHNNNIRTHTIRIAKAKQRSVILVTHTHESAYSSIHIEMVFTLIIMKYKNKNNN